jgi:hypothetical protein
MRPRRRGGRTTDRKPLTSLRTGQPLRPVHLMTAAELWEELVEDACASVAGDQRYLNRQVLCYVRLGKLRGCGEEQAFLDVVAAVRARGHSMPLL